MQIDIPTLQTWLANIDQLADSLVPLIPGQLGQNIGAWVKFAEQLEQNPVLQQLVVFLINNLSQIKTVQDVQKLVGGFTVTNTVA